jgi:hypothetical protein
VRHDARTACEAVALATASMTESSLCWQLPSACSSGRVGQ